MARSTRASTAVERLKARSGNDHYAMVVVPGDRFYLTSKRPDAAPETLCQPLDQDSFVRFVDACGPQKVRKASKLDLAFEKQLKKP